MARTPCRTRRSATCSLFLAGLSRFFADGLSPIALAPGALLPTVIGGVMFGL